jgi:hypothetical protein
MATPMNRHARNREWINFWRVISRNYNAACVQLTACSLLHLAFGQEENRTGGAQWFIIINRALCVLFIGGRAHRVMGEY